MGMEWAWLIPVFSFAVVPLIVLFGKRLPGKGSPLAILAISAGFVLFWWVLVSFVGASPETPGCDESAHTGSLTCNYGVNWFQAGLTGDGNTEPPGGLGEDRVDVDRGISLNWGISIDPLTVVMLGLITFVALMVQVYSLGYMHGDPRTDWYYAFHALFIASMLTLAVADNFLLLYVAWELVGLCSYLLIGFWFERPSAREAAKKAFIVTRIGDVGLLIGILLLWREVGSFSMTAAFDAAQSGAISQGTATIAALLLFAGAAGKSAQFPLHVWLPDAMEGPTPVSALIHAATMVVAGVYLVARAFPIFEASGDALWVVSIVGLVTALGASTIALAATDLKRILAYSTISHLGLMMLSLGAFGYTAAIFHLLAHGFSKALLFLGAGSVMHSTDELDIRKMGGLRKVMPLTALLFSIGALSLGGIPVLAGFWSKDEILHSAWGSSPIIYVIGLVTAFLTAFYMFRLIFVTFYGESRVESEVASHLHESPPVMWVPLAILAIPSALIGLLLGWGGHDSWFHDFTRSVFPETHHEASGNVFLFMAISSVVGLAGIAFAWTRYSKRVPSDEPTNALHKLLANKYYVDEVYNALIVQPIKNGSHFLLWKLVDNGIIDGIVNGVASIIRLIGGTLRRFQTGLVQSYIVSMVLGIVLFLAYYLFFT
jgi:NADH-quinone oxidoreductase subunit L